jgi:hypothetical protein
MIGRSIEIARFGGSGNQVFFEITDAPSASTAIYLERTSGSLGVPSGIRFSLSHA